MKRFFIAVAWVCLALIILGAVAFTLMAIRSTVRISDRVGRELDKESRAYADATIREIITSWSEKELLDRASPDYKSAVTIKHLNGLFCRCRALGMLQKREPAKGDAEISIGTPIRAEYTAKARFEKGEVTIRLGLIKHGDQWQILNFNVKFP